MGIFILVLFPSKCLSAGFGNIKIDLDQKKLEAGKIQVSTQSFETGGEGVKKRVVGVLLINALPSTVWKIISDWENMSNFAPGLDYYKVKYVVPVLPSVPVKKSVIEGQLSLTLLSVLYTMEVSFDAPKMIIHWQLLSSDEISQYKKIGVKLQYHTIGLKNIEGIAYIEPYRKGLKTVLYYAPIIELSMPLPGFIERSIARNTLKGFLNALKKYAEEQN